MAEFSAGLQTQQEERHVILLLLTSSGGKFYEFFNTVALAVPPLTVKNRGCMLSRSCVLNLKNTVNCTTLKGLKGVHVQILSLMHCFPGIGSDICRVPV